MKGVRELGVMLTKPPPRGRQHRASAQNTWREMGQPGGQAALGEGTDPVLAVGDAGAVQPTLLPDTPVWNS